MLGIGQEADTAAARSARRSRSSTSPTWRSRSCSRAPSSGRAGRRPSPTTTRSSSGRRRASSSSRSSRRPRASASAARRASSTSAASTTAPAGSSGRRRSAARSWSGGSVFTVSDAGVRASDLNTLAAQGWAAFPAPAAAGRRARRLSPRRRQWCGGGGRVVSADASAGVSGRGSAGGGSGWGLGSPSGTTGSVEDDAGPVPNSFVAVTVNV